MAVLRLSPAWPPLPPSRRSAPAGLRETLAACSSLKSKALNSANGKNLPQVPAFMFEFTWTDKGEIVYLCLLYRFHYCLFSF